MSAATRTNPTYLMGRTAAEAERLIRQGRFLNPATRRLLTEAGVVAGMRVLDLGSGAGDVALLVAELVGPTGAVVGVDLDPGALAVANERAAAGGLSNVSFAAGDLRTVELAGDFDAVVGRLVLMYVPEPAGALRRLAGLLRPGGVVALQEFNFSAASLQWYPAMPLCQRYWEWMQATVARAGVEPLMGATGRHLRGRRAARASPAPGVAAHRRVRPERLCAGRPTRSAACCRWRCSSGSPRPRRSTSIPWPTGCRPRPSRMAASSRRPIWSAPGPASADACRDGDHSGGSVALLYGTRNASGTRGRAKAQGSRAGIATPRRRASARW